MLDDAEKESLKGIIERTIDKDKFTVSFENLGTEDIPFTVIQPEFMRRMNVITSYSIHYTKLYEVDKYINQIAFSSAEEFVKKFKTKTEAERNAIIRNNFV